MIVSPEGVEMVLYPTDGGCKNFFLLPTIFSSSTVVVHLVGKQEVLVWVLLIELISTCTYFLFIFMYALISAWLALIHSSSWCRCAQCNALLP